MNILVVFYSRTGWTEKVAVRLAQQLNCGLDQVVDTKDRSKLLGYLKAGRDAMFKEMTTIAPVKSEPKFYDLIIVGTPIWAFTVPPPIRTYLRDKKIQLKRVAFFCTQGGSGDKAAFREMEKTCDLKPIATMALTTQEVKEEKYQDKLSQFIQQLK